MGGSSPSQKYCSFCMVFVGGFQQVILDKKCFLQNKRNLNELRRSEERKSMFPGIYNAMFKACLK